MNILVCDDDKSSVDAIGIYLENEGYAIFKAFNGLEAIEIVEEYAIHQIIIDIMMPKMDGIRATIKIQEDKKIPLIMLSAKSGDSDKTLGLIWEQTTILTKPFNPLELIARVKSQLRRYTTLGCLETIVMLSYGGTDDR